MIKGRTESGFEYEIEEAVFNDMELLEAINEIGENPLVYGKVCEKILGKEQKKRLYDSVRTEDGRVPIDKIDREMTEIMNKEKSRKKLITLAGMIAVDETSLICDLAETYGIFDYKMMDLQLVAKLSAGLGENSRIKKKIAGTVLSPTEVLLTMVIDQLRLLVWMNTEDARRGINRPETLLKQITGEYQDETEEVSCFVSGEDFEEERRRLLGGGR